MSRPPDSSPGSRPPTPSSGMIPGGWEHGTLTRFAETPPAVQPMIDVTVDAATSADRRKEGGGSRQLQTAADGSLWTRLVAMFLPRRQGPAAAAPVAPPLPVTVAVYPAVR